MVSFLYGVLLTVYIPPGQFWAGESRGFFMDSGISVGFYDSYFCLFGSGFFQDPQNTQPME